jgi:hypothetical protein
MTSADCWIRFKPENRYSADLDGSNRKVSFVPLGNLAGIAYLEPAGAAK